MWVSSMKLCNTCRRRLKALYESAREVFEQVKVSLQRLAELFVEAVARVLAWVDEHKAYLFLMAAVAAGVVALSAALNLWGLIELEKLAYAASLAPFIPADVKEYSREEAFKMLKEASDPYEKFLEIVREAGAGGVKLAEPWESLRVLIDERGLDEKRKKALFYATLALEEVFRTCGQLVEGVMKEVRDVLKVERVSTVFGELEKYVVDVVRLKELMREEAFQKALETLKKRLLEYETKHPELRELLKVDELRARELVEAGYNSLSEYSDVSFGVKAYAALLAYRELSFGMKTAYGVAAGYWLEEGKAPWLLYYAPGTAYSRAERTGGGDITTIEEAVVEAFRRLFLKPDAERYSRFVDKVLETARQRGGLALEPEPREESDKTWVLKWQVWKALSLWLAKLGRVRRGLLRCCLTAGGGSSSERSSGRWGELQLR